MMKQLLNVFLKIYHTKIEAFITFYNYKLIWLILK
jgi:hypothetical protein